MSEIGGVWLTQSGLQLEFHSYMLARVSRLKAVNRGKFLRHKVAAVLLWLYTVVIADAWVF